MRQVTANFLTTRVKKDIKIISYHLVSTPKHRWSQLAHRRVIFIPGPVAFNQDQHLAGIQGHGIDALRFLRLDTAILNLLKTNYTKPITGQP